MTSHGLLSSHLTTSTSSTSLPAPSQPPNLSSTLAADKSSKYSRSQQFYGNRYQNTSDASIPFGSRYIKTSLQRTCTILGTIDGQVGVLLPVEEKIYKRLNILQHLLCMTLPSLCALNPKDYRVIKTSKYRFDKQKKGVLDANILWQFVSLTSSMQDELATAMGTSADIIFDNLYELNLSFQFF